MLKNKLNDLIPGSEGMNGIYRGVVEDNNDPLKAGRCRIRIFGIHTSNKKEINNTEYIPTSGLTWAEPAHGLAEGSVSGFGLSAVPLNGSHVFLFFENGNHMKPIYFATVPGIPETRPDKDIGFSDPNDTYPSDHRLSEADHHRLAREENTKTVHTHRTNNRRTKIPTSGGNSWNEPKPAFNSTYPNNIVFATHGGIVIEIDSTDKEQRVHLYHPSGNYIEIQKDGNLLLKTIGNKYDIVEKDENKLVRFNRNLTVEGNKKDLVQGNWRIEIQGDVDIKSEGTVKIKGSKIKFN